MKKILIALAVIFVIFVVAILFIGRTFYPDNIAETSPDGGKKNLKTRIYTADYEMVSNTVKETIPKLSSWGSNWKLVGSEQMDDSTEIKAEIPVLMFTDELTVKIKKVEDKVQVDVRSNSRVGKSDFGENARHVNKILSALDEKFGNQ